jgi:protein TonB
MDTDQTPMSGASAEHPATSTVQAAIVSSGWLGAQSAFGESDRRKKMGGAIAASVVSHIGLLLLVIAVIGIKPAVALLTEKTDAPKFVFLQEPGPGGGGGGSPAPAPRKQMEVPKHKAPDPVPVTPPKPVPATPPPPIPTLLAPVETNASNIVQASGTSSVSLASWGGGGKGSGLGSGTGSGVGPGSGGGTGGGVYEPGNGVSLPDPIVEVQPEYTSEAMRNKIQGEVWVEIIVLANGTVGDMKIVKSLDTKNGLDQQALIAAKKWLFRPAKKDGVAVPVRVKLELSFRLH